MIMWSKSMKVAATRQLRKIQPQAAGPGGKGASRQKQAGR